uniref:Uncharacterized protein n=1 Tax=Vibrio splendidus TaxID=29497 RepID=A0A0H3ZUK2_VIBSP|nr:hypothetical protein [Vibrio splendidus]
MINFSFPLSPDCSTQNHGSSKQGREAFIYPCFGGSDLGR